jgi:hypothetical protein
MVDFKTLDDIEREKALKEREEIKKKIVTDVNDVFGKIIKKRKEESEKKKKQRKWWVKLLLALLSLGLFLLVLNFVLGNIWLLKFFIKDLFKLG